MGLLKVQDVKKVAVSSDFSSIFVVNTIFQKNDKNGRPYYEITVSDETGSLDAKIWSDASWFDRREAVSKELAAPKLPMEDRLSVQAQTIGVEGKTTEYRGKTQFNFNKLTLLNQDTFPPAQYMTRSPIPIDKLTERYEKLVNSCRKELSDFVKYIYRDEKWLQFRDWPAAVSHHHAYANGLLEHSLSVAGAAKNLAEAMVESGYNVDVDLVVAGGLLHDLGKIESYKMTAVPEMTIAGTILDHIALGYAKFVQYAEEYGLDKTLTLHLSHIILSHHGHKEFGSPVLPATPEAMIVAASDELDFKMFCWKDTIKDLDREQHISGWNNSTGRRFWDKREDTPEEDV